MVKTVAAAAAVALVASSTTANATHTVPNAVSVSSSAFLVRGGANFHDNHNPEESSKKPSNKQRNKKKRKNKKSTRQEETTTPTQDSKEEEEKPDYPPSPQEVLIQQVLQQEDYYDILGISKTASPQQIIKAYRKRAVQTHPDKVPNHDRRAFDKVAQAYDCLGDDTKRATYDRYGQQGLDATAEGRPPSSFTEDLFKSFFGTPFGNYHRSSTPPPRANRTVRYQLEVTLEELYNGITKTILVDNRKQVQITITVGMHSGQAIVLSGEMDSVQDAIPADLVFVIQQRPHSHFTRKGHDLAMELTVSLKEAVCGMTRTIRHLDGRSVTLSSAKLDAKQNIPCMIQTGDVHVLRGEGMPKPGERDSHGDLYVQYKVEMPTQEAINSLTSEERQQLSELLGKLEHDQHQRQTSAVHDSKRNVHVMEKASTSDFGRASGTFRMDTEQDYLDEDYGRPRRFPFGAASRQFHFSSADNFFSGAFGGGRPFDDDPDDASNVQQCQQM